MRAPLYTTDPEDAVQSTSLDGLTLLFHLPSGATHIVAPPAPQILTALRHGPASLADLMHRLQADYEWEDAPELGALETRIEELEAVGLVSRL